MIPVVKSLSVEGAVGPSADKFLVRKPTQEEAEAAVRTLSEWITPEALEDAAAFAQSAPTDRLKILALRGFVRQLELSFTIPLEKQIARLREDGAI